jgi:hypothetical protein
MSDDENSKRYDLEERTAVFAERSRAFVLSAQSTSKQMKRSERRIL